VPRRASAVIARLVLGSALLWSAGGCSDAPAGDGSEAAPDGSGSAEQGVEPQGPSVIEDGGDAAGDAEDAEDAEDGIIRPSGSGPVWSDVITISDRRYAPDELLADADRELTIVNEDDEAHTLTTFDGTLDVEIGPGERVEVMTPPEPGAYPYVCRFHPEMGGEIDVMGMPR
jgi:plastocyanin